MFYGAADPSKLGMEHSQVAENHPKWQHPFFSLANLPFWRLLWSDPASKCKTELGYFQGFGKVRRRI